MLGIVLVAALSALLLVLLLLPVRVLVRASGRGSSLLVHVGLSAVIVHLEREFDVSHMVEGAVEHIVKRWFGTGEPVAVPFQKTVKRFPTGRWMRLSGGPVRRFLRAVRCRELTVCLRVGGRDAMESALLSGACRAVIGAAMGLMSGWIRLPARTQRIAVTPEFQKRLFQIDATCILQFRLGQAIGTTIRLLFRCYRDPELKAWWRESRRRKRMMQDERTPDSGPHEDGHGEP